MDLPRIPQREISGFISSWCFRDRDSVDWETKGRSNKESLRERERESKDSKSLFFLLERDGGFIIVHMVVHQTLYFIPTSSFDPHNVKIELDIVSILEMRKPRVMCSRAQNK